MNTTGTTVDSPAIELKAGPLRLALRPDLGGAIAGLWHGELPVLRSTEPAALDTSRASACYPLLPYSNRLGYARFRWMGQEHRTRPNFGDSPHSVHGMGWQRAWQVESAREHDAVLHLVHAGDEDWPFAFEARQAFALRDGALSVGLTVTNRASRPAPVGLGWHPYFPKRARRRLHAAVAERWESDASGLPTRSLPQPGLDGDVAHMDFDHCFDGWVGAARLRDERLSLRLSSSLGRLVVYTPPLKDYFCVEPVGHVSNALHMAEPQRHGLRTLQPGEHAEAWMKLEVEAV